jgi:hypothetical protein
MDVFRPQTGSLELIAVRPREVEMEPAAWPDAEPAVDRLLCVSCLPERLDHLVSDFAAAHAEARPNRRDQIARVGPELPSQCGDADSCRALNRSPPPGVHRRDRASLRIRKEDWRTVGDPHRDDELRVVGEDDVGFRWHPLAVLTSRDGYADAVHLLYQPDCGRLGTERGGHGVPLGWITTKRQVMRGEEMTGDRRERLALQTGSDRR